MPRSGVERAQRSIHTAGKQVEPERHCGIRSRGLRLRRQCARQFRRRFRVAATHLHQTREPDPCFNEIRIDVERPMEELLGIRVFLFSWTDATSQGEAASPQQAAASDAPHLRRVFRRQQHLTDRRPLHFGVAAAVEKDPGVFRHKSRREADL